MSVSAPSVTRAGAGAWRVLALLAVVVTLMVALFIDQEKSPDFAPYVDVSEALRGMTLLDLVPFETLSRGELMLLTDLLDNSRHAVLVAHWINILVFIAGFVLVLSRLRDNWRGVLLVLAVYGVLLSFITLRATPAYLLVVYAILDQQARPRRSMVLTLIASGFHVSALMALPALLANQYGQRLSERLRQGLCWVLCLFGFCVYFAIMAGFSFGEELGGFFDQRDDLVKFVTYATDASEPSLGHRIYFGIATLLAALALLTASARIKAMRLYIALSYTIFALAAMSPVVAYRQSLYWTIPILLALPWKRWIGTPTRSFGIVLSCVVLYFVNVYTIFGS